MGQNLHANMEGFCRASHIYYVQILSGMHRQQNGEHLASRNYELYKLHEKTDVTCTYMQYAV